MLVPLVLALAGSVAAATAWSALVVVLAGRAPRDPSVDALVADLFGELDRILAGAAEPPRQAV